MFNRVTLIGNVGQDPEIRSTQDGREVASFSLATSDRWKDKDTGEKKEKTEWHRIVCFHEPLVRVIKEYVTKGSKLYIEGALVTRKWTDKDGIERYSTEINVKMQGKLLMLDGKSEASGSTRPPTPPAETYQAGGAVDDEIPF
jgi:single-strand DNA-binding protein